MAMGEFCFVMTGVLMVFCIYSTWVAAWRIQEDVEKISRYYERKATKEAKEEEDGHGHA